MIKGSVHEEDITTLNIYALHIHFAVLLLLNVKRQNSVQHWSWKS